MPATLQNKLEKLLAETAVPWAEGALDKLGNAVVAEGSGSAAINLRFGYPVEASIAGVVETLRERIRSETGLDDVAINLDCSIERHAVQGTLSPVEGIKNILVVSSAKGGVSRSKPSDLTTRAASRSLLLKRIWNCM